MTLPLLMSRWRMPARCASASASAIWSAIGDGLSRGERPVREQRMEGLPLDQLHDDEGRAAAPRRRIVRLVQDVRVIQGRRGRCASRSNRAPFSLHLPGSLPAAPSSQPSARGACPAPGRPRRIRPRRAARGPRSDRASSRSRSRTRAPRADPRPARASPPSSPSTDRSFRPGLCRYFPASSSHRPGEPIRGEHTGRR